MSRLRAAFSTFFHDLPRVERTADVAERRESFTYNYDGVAPLALAASVPKSQLPARKWVSAVVRRGVEIVLNSCADDDGTFPDIRAYLTALEQGLKGLPREFAADSLRAFASAIAAVGFPDNEQELRIFLKRFLESLGSELLFQTIKLIVDIGRPEGKATSIADFEGLFRTIELPEIAEFFDDDDVFANLRVAGPNPMTLFALKALPEGVVIPDDTFSRAMGESDTVGEAIAQGRVYAVDYAALGSVLAGTFPRYQKYVNPALAIFAVPIGGDAPRLLPVMVRCRPDEPCVFPGDAAWRDAKAVFNAADSTYHEAVVHLGQTHLVVEPFVVATHRTLLASERAHPIGALLKPHFEGTIFINGAAQAALIQPTGIVDAVLGPTIDGARMTAAAGALAVLGNFREAALPANLAARGVKSTALPYPYRDDALRIWEAIETWVCDYVDVYYASDNAVGQDTALEAWAAELRSFDGARVAGFGDRDNFESKAGLVATVTQLIFRASAQHAAVNFPQNEVMSFPPAMPWAVYAPSPKNPDVGDNGTWMATLPRLDPALTQLNIGFLLGGVYYTQLGFYDSGTFDEPAVYEALAKFRAALDAIEVAINERDALLPPRFRYPYLLPSKIPQSTNI